jgi:hypothetical protein
MLVVLRKCRQVLVIVLRKCRQVLVMGPCLGLLVGLQLCDRGLQYYTRKVDGIYVKARYIICKMSE